MTPAIALVMSSVSDEERGMASGIFCTMRQIGATLCFAIVGVVITNVNIHHLKPLMHRYQLNDAQIVHLLLNPVSTPQEHAIKSAAATIYSHAFTYGMWITALFALISLLFVLSLKTRKTTIGAA